MADVFLSYARADRARVRLIAAGLTAEGFEVWWDPEIKPGRKWNDVLRKALEGAAAVIVVWSKTSAKSDWVLAEASHAQARKGLVPCAIQNVIPPIPFNMIQSADLTRWRGDGADSNWTDLLRQVRVLVEAKRKLAAAPPPPGEAYGQERAAIGASAPEPTYQAARGRGQLGPRRGRLLSGIVVTAVVTAGVWFAVASQTHVDRAQTETPPINTQASPWGAPSAPIPAAPHPTAPNPATSPGGDASATPVAPPQDARPPTLDPAATRDALDACVSNLMQLCPQAPQGTAAGFRQQGRVSSAEARFLRALNVSVAIPPDAASVRSCRASYAQHQGPIEADRVLRAACANLSFPGGATSPTRPPSRYQAESNETPARTNDTTVSDVLGALRDNAARTPTRSNPSTQPSTDPQTGRWSPNR